MTIMLFAAVLGVAAGFVAGGSIRHLAERRLRGTGLTLLWIGLVVLTARDWLPWAHELYLASFGVALLVVVVNARAVPALLVAGVGLVANLTVVAVNGGMPYTPGALRSAGIPRPEGSIITATPQRHLQLETDRLYWLMDHFPVAAGPIREILSPGDILVAVGLGLTCCTSLLPARRRRPAPLVPVGRPPAGARPRERPPVHRLGHPLDRRPTPVSGPSRTPARTPTSAPTSDPTSARTPARASGPPVWTPRSDIDPTDAGDLFWAERARLAPVWAPDRTANRADPTANRADRNPDRPDPTANRADRNPDRPDRPDDRIWAPDPCGR